MKLLPSGSTPWLIAHELRLLWRGRGTRASGQRGLLIFLAALAVLGMMAGLPVAGLLAQVGDVRPSPQMVVIVDAILLFIFTFMLSLTVQRASQIFYERGDLDLLLSSPLPARRVLTARCLGMAFNAALFYLAIITPFILPAILEGQLRWLAIYPVILAMSLLATSIGLSIAMSLFALIGPRATRTLAQVLAALIGAAVYMASQFSRFMFRGQSGWVAEHSRSLAETGVFNADQPAAWPTHALLGEPLYAGALFAAALLLFLLVVNVLGARFARDAAAAAGVGAGGRAPSKARVRGFTGGPFQATLRKELRLMRRDVVLMSQVLLRILYLVTAAFVFWRSISTLGDFAVPAMAGWLVFMSSQIAATLAWISVSGEEGFELLAASPAKPKVVRRAKLAAALIPTAVIVLIPLALLCYVSPQAAAAALVFGACAALSAGLIAIWYERPAPRSVFRRRRNSSMTAVFADLVLSILWASAAGFAAGPWWMFAAAPVILAVVALLALQRPQRGFAEVLEVK